MKDLRLASLRTARGWKSRAAYAREVGLSGPTCWRIEATSKAVHASTLGKYGAPMWLDARAVEVLRPSEQAGIYESRAVCLPAELWELVDLAAAARKVTTDDVLAMVARTILAGGKR